MLLLKTVVGAALLPLAFAQFGFFDHVFQQQGHPQEQPRKPEIKKDSNWVEHEYDKEQCDKYLCEDTLACVDSPLKCPCPFAASQLKCILPDKKSYVCISKPADPKAADARDCSFVNKAWKGEV